MTRFFLPALAAGCLLSLATAYHAAAQNPGTRDPSFNESQFFLSKIVPLSDGRYLGLGANDGGKQTQVHRFLADGVEDGSFTLVRTDEYGPSDFLLLPDGKILISGTFTEVSGQSHQYVARLNENGSLDASFSPDLSGLFVGIRQMLRQKSGKIVVDAAHIAASGVAYSTYSRLNADGSLDKSFETTVGTGLSGTMRLQSDDKIIVAGQANKVVNNQFESYRLARLKVDGPDDTSFRAAAVNPREVGFFPADVLILPDDRIVTGGNIDGDKDLGELDTAYVRRYSAEGAEDTGFKVSITGPAVPDSNTNVNVAGLALQKDGKILLCGQFTAVNGVPNQAAARLNADGTTDATFSALGTFNDPQGAGSPDEIAIQRGGKVLLSGFLLYKGGIDKGIIRLSNDEGSTTEPPPPTKQADLSIAFDGVKAKTNAKGTKVKVKGKLNVSNAGKKAAKKVVVGAYVSDDAILSADDKALSTVALADLGLKAVKKNAETGPLKVAFQGGATEVGTLSGKYLIVVADPQNTLEEPDKTNNVVVVGPLP